MRSCVRVLVMVGATETRCFLDLKLLELFRRVLQLLGHACTEGAKGHSEENYRTKYPDQSHSKDRPCILSSLIPCCTIAHHFQNDEQRGGHPAEKKEGHDNGDAGMHRHNQYVLMLVVIRQESSNLVCTP